MIDKQRQVLFSIIQMDPGSESMLGWCKNNALNRIKNEYNGAERVGFRSTGNVGDIYYSIKVDGAQGGNVFVNIALSLVQDVSAYFGYASKVETRCWCRDIVLAETAAPTVSTSYTDVQESFNVGNPNPAGLLVTRTTRTVTYRANGAIITTSTGVWDYYWPVAGFGVFYTFSNWIGPNDGVVPQAPVGQAFNGTYDSQSGSGIISGEYTDDPIYASVLAIAESGHVQRSAVFLTDGTELASAPITYPYDPPDNTLATPVFATTASVGAEPWSGGSFAALFTPHPDGGGSFNGYDRTTDLTFVVPDDACYTKLVAPAYPGVDAGAAQWIIDWNAGQAEGLTREHARRKKCSDGMYTYLRNGFLPPEFEYFIKTTATRSTLLKRKIPMQIIENSSNTIFDDTDGSGNRTRIVSATVTLAYDVTDVQGNVTTKQKTFTGTAKRIDIEHRDPIYNQPYLSTYSIEYQDFPMLGAGAFGPRGKALPLSDQTLQPLYSNIINFRLDGMLKHDDAGLQDNLILIANGRQNINSEWVVDTELNGSPAYVPTTNDGLYNTSELLPTPEKTQDTFTFAHPQFLLDYIADSKPTEVKSPDTPSTNWLASRLIDNETITVIPLSFILADGTDRGMYPLNVTDEIPARIKVTGYAKTRFKYADASFTEPAWTELDAPQFFDYQTAWGTKNCVCIGSKNPWTDTKTAARTQGKHIGNTPPDGYTLTDEEKLYHEVKKAISAK